MSQRKHDVLFGRQLDLFARPEEINKCETVERQDRRISRDPDLQKYAGQILDISEFNDELFTLLRNARHGIWQSPAFIYFGRPRIEGLPRLKEICRPPASRLAKNADVGLLNLPSEILSIVIGHLDPCAAGRFAATCSVSLYAVSNYTPLKHLREHAGWAFRSLFISGIIEKFSLRYMYSVLCSKTCVSCQEKDTMATHVFLPTFERCCVRCLKINPDFNMIRVPDAEVIFNLSRADICGDGHDISFIRTTSGDVRNNQAFAEFRERLFIPVAAIDRNYTSVREARERCLEVHGTRKLGYRLRAHIKWQLIDDNYCKFVLGRRSDSFWNTHQKNYKNTGKPRPFTRTGAFFTETTEVDPDTGFAVTVKTVREALPSDVPIMEWPPAVAVPWLCVSKTGAGHQVHDGLYCAPCKLHLPAEARATAFSALPYFAFYTQRQFLDHAKTCPHVARRAQKDAESTDRAKQKHVADLRKEASTNIKKQLRRMDKDRVAFIKEMEQRKAEARAKRLSLQVEKDSKTFLEARRQASVVEETDALLVDATAAASVEKADEREFKKSIARRQRHFLLLYVKIGTEEGLWTRVRGSIVAQLRRLGYL